MKYHRGSIEETMAAAKRSAMRRGAQVYVYATAYGLTIGTQSPPFNLHHYVVRPNGSTEFIDWEPSLGAQYR
jgi:hypothetical protein